MKLLLKVFYLINIYIRKAIHILSIFSPYNDGYSNSINLFVFNKANDLTFPIFPPRMASPSGRRAPYPLCGAKLRALACYQREDGAHLNIHY